MMDHQTANVMYQRTVGLMLDQRLRRWPNNKTTVGQRLVLTGQTRMKTFSGDSGQQHETFIQWWISV